MHDFGEIIYLDLHKTGSSYISEFLKTCCLLTEKKFHKHDWIRENYDSNKFYFISIRHPFSLYSSLYRFGLDGKGDVRNRLRASNNLSAYSSFNSFADFLLDERNANLLGYGYNQFYAQHIGFMSFRFLKLSLQFPHKKIDYALKTKGNIEDLHNLLITDLEIKNEDLNGGLRELATEIHPYYFRQDAVIDFLSRTPKINASNTTVEKHDVMSDTTLSILRNKERLLLSKY